MKGVGIAVIRSSERPVQLDFDPGVVDRDGIAAVGKVRNTKVSGPFHVKNLTQEFIKVREESRVSIRRERRQLQYGWESAAGETHRPISKWSLSRSKISSAVLPTLTVKLLGASYCSLVFSSMLSRAPAAPKCVSQHFPRQMSD